MKTFYEYLKIYKDHRTLLDEARLTEWIYGTKDFPKFSTDFHEISNFLEVYSPFPDALNVFDAMWEQYLVDYNNM